MTSSRKRDDDLHDPLRAVGVDAGAGRVERALGERPDHLHEEPVAGADPAVERDPVDAELVRERAHVEPLGRQEAAPGQRERVGGRGPRGDGHAPSMAGGTRAAARVSGRPGRPAPRADGRGCAVLHPGSVQHQSDLLRGGGMRRTDIEAVGDVAGEALAAGGGLVKSMHEGIAGRPFGVLGAAAAPVRVVHDGVARAVYGGVRGALRTAAHAGAAVAAARRRGRRPRARRGPALVDRARGAQRPLRRPPRRPRQRPRPGDGLPPPRRGRRPDAGRPGRRLPRRHLAGGRVRPRARRDRRGLAAAAPPRARPRAPAHVRRAPAGRAQLHAAAPPLQHRPAHLRATAASSPACSTTLVAGWPGGVEELVLVGHSMGGLVARSACHYGDVDGRRWTAAVRHVFCLGTPHLGADLEKGVNVLGWALGRLPGDQALGRRAQRPQRRHQGPALRLVRRGGLERAARTPTSSCATAARRSRSSPAPTTTSSARRCVEGPARVACSATCSSACRARRDAATAAAARSPSRSSNGRELTGLTHFDLLNHPAVYEQLRTWIVRSPSRRALPPGPPAGPRRAPRPEAAAWAARTPRPRGTYAMSDQAPPRHRRASALHRPRVALDGSASGDLALSAAVTAARRDGAALTLVTVARDVVAARASVAGRDGLPGRRRRTRSTRRPRAWSARRRTACRRRPRPHGRPARAGPDRRSRPKPAPVRTTRSSSARGVGRDRGPLGSVSQHVLHHADVAVFVAQRRERTPRSSGWRCARAGLVPWGHRRRPGPTIADRMPNADDMLAVAAARADELAAPGLDPRPRRRVAVLACMDTRIDLFPMLGLERGDAHIVRNAGGLATDDAIRSLSASQRLLGTEEVVVVMHRGCGLHGASEDEFAQALADDGVLPTWRLGAFEDVEATLRHSLARLRASPELVARDHIRGFIFDPETGGLHEVR